MGFEEAVKRHIFANPLNPTICPVLALSVTLLLFHLILNLVGCLQVKANIKGFVNT